jgi:hypothetical protein
LVTACRVSAEPSAKREIDSGVPALSLPINDSRVASPSAANTTAGST